MGGTCSIEKTETKNFMFLAERLMFNWLGHRFRTNIFFENFLPVVFVLFVVVLHILNNEKFKLLSKEI